ncbi:MAG: ATP-grasp domain-containing protein [Xanthomonadaceae bacterium]|nr:ATP-grasp domain-containing protein [Xanthomonadaceae bacterium]
MSLIVIVTIRESKDKIERMSKSLHVLIIFDLNSELPREEYSSYLKEDVDWKVTSDVKRSLERLGHEVRLLGIYNDLAPFLDCMKDRKPDLIFNLSEAFNSERDFEPHMASLFELFSVKYTGASPEALRLCKDKGLAKKILSYHRLQVPKFVVSHKRNPLRSLKNFIYPAFIKPLSLEASEGISQVSFVENEAECLERIKFIHDKMGVDAIIEEYIDGREIYVSVMGNDRLAAFPARELYFEEMPDGVPKFATFHAKWNDAYRKKWGIATDFAKPLGDELEKKILETSKKIYRVLKMSGYGRIDLRIRNNNEIVFLEANPNPNLAKDEDFALSVLKSGVKFDELIQKIISLAFSRESIKESAESPSGN